MSRGAPPLRFLALVLGGWACARALFLAPGLLTKTAEAELPAVQARAPLPAYAEPPFPRRSRESGNPVSFSLAKVSWAPAFAGVTARVRGDVPDAMKATLEHSSIFTPGLSPAVLGGAISAPPVDAPLAAIEIPAVAQAPPTSPAVQRWSLSSWGFVRRGADGAQLAPGGVLGGSQVGARASYRLHDRLALSARLSAPLTRSSGAEAALGVESQPLRAVPVRLLAERRQAIGSDGRSAFALLAYGGVSGRPIIGAVRLDAYAQAGVVGLKSRDGFADGAVRLSVPVLGDNIEVGVGAWGAAQPGVSRLDLGPQLSFRLPVLDSRMRLGADYRVRVAGDARPGSGPALTLSTDF